MNKKLEKAIVLILLLAMIGSAVVSIIFYFI